MTMIEAESSIMLSPVEALKFVNARAFVKCYSGSLSFLGRDTPWCSCMIRLMVTSVSTLHLFINPELGIITP